MGERKDRSDFRYSYRTNIAKMSRFQLVRAIFKISFKVLDPSLKSPFPIKITNYTLSSDFQRVTNLYYDGTPPPGTTYIELISIDKFYSFLVFLLD